MKLLNQLGYVDHKAFLLLKKDSKHLKTIAELIRFNTLLSVARAGTGHLGSSLSMIEFLTEIYFRSFSFYPKNKDSKNRDIFILSKGHGVPSLYAVLAAKGYIKTEDLDVLRRLKGLAGHCDIETSGIEANTGSLAMGLSKAVGHAIAKKRFGLKGDVIVIVGNGELQEGQCWEALLSAVSFSCDNLYVVIDDNEVQTDKYTKEIVKYRNLRETFKNMGFAIEENNGQNPDIINKVFGKLKKIKGKPKLFYCRTIKGQGVSFMEHTRILKDKNARYIWHNKAPNLVQLELALSEIIKRVSKSLIKFGIDFDIHNALRNIPKEPMNAGVSGKSLIGGLSQGLLKLAGKYNNFVVFDGDLEEDCGFIGFHEKYPRRFFEMGIMEQHMVSTASAFSRLGYLPVIATYAAFLSSRANEQLYNLASENARALITGVMSGIIPATPGKSHQAFRDIACMKNIPNLTMYQPVTADDCQNILGRYFGGGLGQLLYMRLSMAPSAVELPTPNKNLPIGMSQIMRKGKDAIIIGIGPVILGECMLASEILAKEGIEVEVWNHPWLYEFDKETLKEASERNIPLIIVEDHFHRGGFGESLLSFMSLNRVSFKKIKHAALKTFPETGFREEILKLFGLERTHLASLLR